MASFESEVELRTEISRLQGLLEEKDSNLELAGQIGHQLLEKNSELERHNEELFADFSGRVEALQQENFSLRSQLSASRKREKEAQSLDEERIREELEIQHQHKLESQKISLQRATDSVHQQLSVCEADLEKKTLLVEQLQEKAVRQDAEVCELRGLLSSRSAADYQLESTLEELQCALDTERCQRAAVTTELREALDEIERLQLDVVSGNKNMEALSDRLAEQETQAVQWYNAMQESRDEVAMWRNQYEMLKSSNDNSTHASKGNSLFGELEDERQRYEHEAITLRLKLKNMEKQHNINRQQLRQLKAQMVALLQSNRSQADQREIQRLKQNVAEARQEAQMLRAKLRCFEEVEASVNSAYHMEQLQKALPAVASGPKSPPSNRVFVDFLQQQVELSRRRETEVRNELETCRMLLLAESNKLHQTESQLHQHDLELQQIRADSVRARMQLDELRQQRPRPQPSATVEKSIQTEKTLHPCTTKPLSPPTSPTHHKHCSPCSCDELYIKPEHSSESSPFSSPLINKSTKVETRAPLAAVSTNLQHPRISDPAGKSMKCAQSPSPVKQALDVLQLTNPSRKTKVRTVYVKHNSSAPNECAQQ